MCIKSPRSLGQMLSTLLSREIAILEKKKRREKEKVINILRARYATKQVRLHLNRRDIVSNESFIKIDDISIIEEWKSKVT